MPFLRGSLALCIAVVLCAGAQAGPADTVLWISIDGMRGDYVSRATDSGESPESHPLPFFTRLISEGAHTRHLRPVFPSLTFPNHASQATGVGVEAHGITANNIFAGGRDIRYPGKADLLLAEPIWLTAQRQGVETAVSDWPLSQQQAGTVVSAHFDEKFDASLSDSARLDRLLHLWKANPDLRLIMGYVGAIDKAGHQYGPDAPETREAVTRLDATLSDFFQKALDLWKSHAPPGAHLHFLLTTDHGMAPVTHKVNQRLLVGSGLATGVRFVTSGNICNLHLDKLPESRRSERIRDILEAVEKHPFARAFTRDNLPPDWQYSHPERTGDLVLVLKSGYIFAFDAEGLVSALGANDEPRGMHGYPVETEPLMEGLAILWRTPDPIGPLDLGPVSNLQLHPTVARLLGIAPAPAATAPPLSLPSPQ